MSWQSKTLADSMKSVATAARKGIASLREEIAMVQSQLNAAQATIQAGQDLSAAASVAVADAASSGIYHLTLEPEEGSWASRALNAADAPPLNPNDYCAIVANITISTSLAQAQGALNAMKSAAEAVIPEPPQFFSLPNPPAAPSVSVPDFPDPEPLPANKWKSATMGDVFPSVKAEMQSKLEKAKQKQAQAERLLTELQTKLDELTDKLSEQEDFIQSLENNGVYSLILPPEPTPSADWYSRMTTADGAPTTDSEMVSAGTVTVIIAPSFSELVSKFEGFKKKAV